MSDGMKPWPRQMQSGEGWYEINQWKQAPIHDLKNTGETTDTS